MNFRATKILKKVSSLKLNVQLSSRAKREPKKIGASGYLFLVSFATELIHTCIYTFICNSDTLMEGCSSDNILSWSVAV